MALSTDNIIAISNLLAKNAVEALISTEPVLPTAYKGDAQTYENRDFQSGETIDIRVADQPMMPAQDNVIQIDPIINSTIPVTVLQYNDGMQISGVAQEYAIGGMKRIEEEIGRPRGKNLAVKASILCYEQLGTAMNFVGTPGAAMKTAADWGLAQAALNDQLAMNEGLYVAMSNQSMAETASDLAENFNPTRESATAYMDGVVQQAMNLNFYSTSNIPNHTNGSAVGTGLAGMKVSVNVVTGASSVTVSGGTATGSITTNSLIWFADGYAVQPNTKKRLSTFRYFSVAFPGVTLAGGAGVIPLTQPIYGPENPKLQNITVLPTAALSFVGIVGTASHTYEQAFWYKKKAFSFIGLRLPDLFALDASNANYEGVPIKVHAFADGTNYLNMIRWDMLCAAKIRQWRHCGRSFTRDLG
jgi:P22 coat protein - gene protein 5